MVSLKNWVHLVETIYFLCLAATFATFLSGLAVYAWGVCGLQTPMTLSYSAKAVEMLKRVAGRFLAFGDFDFGAIYVDVNWGLIFWAKN